MFHRNFFKKLVNVSFLSLITTGSLLAGKIELEIKRDFPKSTLFRKVEGDLNNDGIVDYAAILWNPGNKKALLVFYFSDSKGKLRLQTRAPSAICVGCGGPKAIMNEPLGKLSINAKGILWITYEGGSREAWTDILKWRFDKKQNDFLLIGETQTTVDNFEIEPAERIDINYLTNKINRSVGKKQKVCAFSLPSKIWLSSFEFPEKHVSNQAAIIKQCIL